MKQNISILFLIRKSRLSKTGEAAITMRLTVSGQFVEINTGRKVAPKNWNQKKEQVVSRTPAAVETNAYLSLIKTKIYEIQASLEKSDKPYTVVTLKQMFINGKGGAKMFTEVFQEHINYMTKLIGIDFHAKTVMRYERCLRYFQEMYFKNNREKDLPLELLTTKILLDFDLYLKVEKGICHNTAVHYIKCVKKIINIGLNNGWIQHNPGAKIKCAEKEVDIDFLLPEELEIFREKKFNIVRLQQVQDVYLFCCFTGLAYIDVEKLIPEQLVKDKHGKTWIRKRRFKTDIMCEIPLLEIPLAILEKYKDDPECLKNGKLLPVISNQRMNSYLKEIADVCGFKKKLTTHTARHTFATTVCLANGVSIENLAKMLGHTNIRTTQHYAKVLNSTVLGAMEDVGMVFNRLSA